MSKVPSLYVVHPDLPVKNLKEFVAYAKSKPGQLNYGSAGNGSAGHLAFEYLKMVSEIFVLHVPYRGTGPMLTDLMSGRLDAASVGAPALLQFIKAGRLRCIATGTSTRLAQLPDVATVAVDTALAVGNTGPEFDAFIKAEQARWKPVIVRAQIKPDGA